VLLGGPGSDKIQGHEGPDQLVGDEGNDLLEGGEGGDVLDGGADNDYLFGGFGNDAYDGGDGTDTADFSDATTPVNVTLNGAADDGRAFEGDLVHATIESLVGGLDDDQLQGNDGNGILEGGGGNDILDGGPGADTFIGGYCAVTTVPRCADGAPGGTDPKGVDMVSYANHPGPVSVNLSSAGASGLPGEGDTLTADVEGAGGSNFDDVLAGDAKLNHLHGGPGDDRISGAEGDDALGGGLGNDTLTGDVGNDIVDGAEGNDTLNGTDGNDTLRGFTGNDILDGGAGADTMSGGDGTDTVTYASRSADVRVDTLGDPDDGQQGENDQVRTDVESVRAGSGDDSINIADGAAGAVICGGGTDQVDADAADEIGSGCEGSGVRQSSACAPASTTARVSGRNATVRLRCSFNARGSVRLRTKGRVRIGKGKARRLNLGRRSFTGRANQVVSVRVRISSSGRRALSRRSSKRLRVDAIFSIRRDGASSSRTNRRTMTLRASG
jgi:Ca2+-binding RTX toxin-like protein